jgi:phytol kinase
MMAPGPGVRPWVGIAAVVLALAAMLSLLHLLRSRVSLHPELSRKLAHVGLGLTTLTFPWLFHETWPVVVVGALATATLLALRYLPALRRTVGGGVLGVDRSSGGDLYFPIAVTGLWLLANGDWVLYALPLLTLTLADATAALIGITYGRLQYDGADGKKSIEGSIAFFVVAFLATHVPLLLFTDAGRAESLLIALTLGMLVMLLEAVAWRGLDNIFIPFGGFLLLRAFLGLDAAALLVRLGVTAAMLALVLFLRHRRTLNDTALVAGVLVGYVAWFAGGWRWLVPPLILLATYAALWPRNVHLRQRPHDMVAMFSVTSTGLLWLLLATGLRRAELYYPYTLSFAANLCFIGITWYRDYRREASKARAILTSAAPAWGLFFVPWIAVGEASRLALAAAALAIAPLLLGGAAFTLTVPDVRGRPSAEFPWLRQALLGLGASALGLVMFLWLQRAL